MCQTEYPDQGDFVEMIPRSCMQSNKYIGTEWCISHTKPLMGWNFLVLLNTMGDVSNYIKFASLEVDDKTREILTKAGWLHFVELFQRVDENLAL